jgi:hypothetical protein
MAIEERRVNPFCPVHDQLKDLPAEVAVIKALMLGIKEDLKQAKEEAAELKVIIAGLTPVKNIVNGVVTLILVLFFSGLGALIWKVTK